MNIVFAALGYRVYTVEMARRDGAPGASGKVGRSDFPGSIFFR